MPSSGTSTEKAIAGQNGDTATQLSIVEVAHRAALRVPDRKLVEVGPTLEAKLLARNYAAELFNAAFPVVVAAVRPFIGKKVTLVGGGLTVEFARAMGRVTAPFADRGAFVDAWVRATSSSLRFIVRVDATNGRGISQRCELPATLGEIDLGILKSVTDDSAEYRSNFTASEILAARMKVKRLEHELTQARQAFESFGEYDQP